jgi:branched-chain amino acid transport system substrate-binding protein
MIATAAAAAEYVNAELGGIGGRPIELIPCETQNTPESVLGCAGELIGAEPLLVIPGPDFASPAALETYLTAGMPLIGGAAYLPQEFAADNRVLFQGWSASLFPGMTYFAINELDAENIVAVSFEDPQNEAILGAFMEPMMQEAGLPSLQFVGTPASAPDFTAPLAVAVNSDADAILAFGLPCEPILQAYAGLNTDIPIVLPDNCTDPNVLESVGDAADGAYFVIQYDSPTLSPDDPETSLYTQVLENYGTGDIRETSIGLSGFATVLNIHDVLDDVDVSSLTSAEVLEIFRSQDSGPNFLIDGDFDCANPPFEPFPALCKISALFAQFTGDELVAVTDWVGADEMWS